MSHHHHGESKNHHGHHHDHGHQHDHQSHHCHQHQDTDSNAPAAVLSEADKLVKMVEHWIHHSEEHARSYREWARRADNMGYGQVYSILEEVASATESQNRNLEKILLLMREDPSAR